MERMIHKKIKSSFATLEYAILIAVVVVALVGVSSYVRRGLSGRFREVGDTFGFGRQYGAGSKTKKYDCRTTQAYTCGIPCWIICSPPNYPCQPSCSGVEGSGLSDISMDEACKAAVANALSRTHHCPSNKPVTTCGWQTSQITWNDEGTKVLSDKTVCPNQP